VLWGNGHQRRELVHVRSFVDLLLNLTETVDKKLLNLGAGKDYSIREFAQIICDQIGFDPNMIIYDTTRYVGAVSKILSVDEIKTHIPDYDSRLISLQDGLAETIDWFITEKAYLEPSER
jgi:GDP-L-fucose synthase